MVLKKEQKGKYLFERSEEPCPAGGRVIPARPNSHTAPY